MPNIEPQPTSHLLAVPANLSPAQREQVQHHLNSLGELVGQNLIRLSHPLDISSRREAFLSQPLGEGVLRSAGVKGQYASGYPRMMRGWGIHFMRDVFVFGKAGLDRVSITVVPALERLGHAEGLELLEDPSPVDNALVCRSLHQINHLALRLTREECGAVHDHFYPGQDLGEGDLYLSVENVLNYQEAVGATSEGNDAMNSIARKTGSYVQQFAAGLAVQHLLES